VSTSGRDNVSEVKSAIDIVDFLGDYLTLKPAGSGRFKGLCPFHQEKTPSFHVSRDRQGYYCFGCGKKGDIFTFMEEMEGLSFREALETLADRAGIRLERFQGSSEKDDERTALQKLCLFAARYYVLRFRDDAIGRAARGHVYGRDLSEDVVKRFGVGFAPEGWQNLVDAARSEGFSDRLLDVAGLAKHGQQGLYDRFRNRVIFPIRDVAGKVVAFGGRTLGDDPAKYLNSPETPIYHKSKVLYGLYESRDAIRKRDEAILVEGYFDLLRCADAGIDNVVATCGTSLTGEQARIIRRYATRVLVVFDGDEAGIRAALRSIGVLAAAGLSVRALTLPEGQDPDDFIRANGPDTFTDMARGAEGFVAFYVRMAAERTESIEGRTAVARELFEVVSGLDDPLRQDEYLKLIAHELGLDEFRCRQSFTEYQHDRGYRSIKERGAAISDAVSVNAHDREFVSILMERDDLLRATWMSLEALDLTDSPVLHVVEALAQAEGGDALPLIEGESARALYLAAAAAPNTWGRHAEEIVRERTARLKWDSLVRESERLHEAIRRESDDTRKTELTLEKIDVDRRIQQVRSA